MRPWDVADGLTSSASVAAPWFAMIQGKQAGPFQLADLAERIRSGEVATRTYVWREGMPGWKRAADAPPVAALLPALAPAPGAEPPIAKPETEGRNGAPVSLDLQSDLFADADHSPPQLEGRPLPGLKLSARLPARPEALAGQKLASVEASAPTESAFDPLTPSPSERDDSAPPADSTGFFIAEAGMNERNPPWKIAGFAIALIGIPAAVLYLLSALKVGPLVVMRVDASGQEVKESVFSARGVSGIGDLLLGRRKASPASAPESTHPAARTSVAKSSVLAVKAVDPPATKPVSPQELQAFYADSSHRDIGPSARKAEEKGRESGVGRLAEAEVTKVVAQTQPAFQFCIEQEMKKNPTLKGGKIFINAMVGSSGMVKSVAIDRRDIDASNLGECLKNKARRMTFSAFSGDDTEVQIPLILTTAL